jgi:glycosyltransferase involved in cell wall biosynthesis
MRILHVIPSVLVASGGPAEGLRQLCQVYRSGGHDIDVASLDAPRLLEKVPYPAKVVPLGPAIGTYGYTPRASEWFKRNVASYDVVFLNGVWQYDTLAAYRALAKTGVPYAVFAHGMLDPYFKQRSHLKHLKKSIYWRLCLSKILRNAQAVLFTSEEEKFRARLSFSGYSVRELVVPFGIYGPQSELEAASAAFFDRWDNLRDARLILSIGRIHPKKGIDLLLRGFAVALSLDPSWRLVIAGSGDASYQLKLEQLAAALGIADRVTWTGMLSGNLKWGAFAASEVFVLPSHQENFGIVVAEAMACGLPVIVSNKVNIWRDVAATEAGLICDDSADGISEALSRWATMSPEQIASMRMRSMDCFESCFDYTRTQSAVLDVLDRLVNRRLIHRPLEANAYGMERGDS